MTNAVAGQPRERPTLVGRLLEWRRQWLSMDKDARALAFAVTPIGIVAMHATLFACLFGCEFPRPALAITAIALPLIAVFPARKFAVIALSTVGFLLLTPLRTVALTPLPQYLIERYDVTWLDPMAVNVGMAFLFMALAYGALSLQARYRHSAAARRPVIASLVVFSVLVAMALTDMLPATGQILLWTLIAMFSSWFWYLAYALGDQRGKDATPRWQRVGLFRPMWGPSPTPIGKGASYLRKFEAKTQAELAAVRLRAVKLAVWAAILFTLARLAGTLVHDVAAIPSLMDTLAAAETSGPPLPTTGWMIVVSHYLLSILNFCVYGHLLVATIRMAGFGIPRNSARPLSARTLAEFWNRFYFYFKELLVDFFFYPAFLRWFKTNPKLRIAFATFCAAGAGNFLYHFMRDVDIVARSGLLAALHQFQSYAVYCALLSAGLIISQLRNRRPKPEDGFLKYDVLPRINVGLFFCLLAVLGEGEGEALVPLTVRLEFLLSLLGVRP